MHHRGRPWGQVGPVPSGPAEPAAALPVDRPEAGRGERDEHGRMLGDGVGDAFAAGHACGEQVPGVALVLVAARLAAAGPPVAAAHVGDAVELVGRAVPLDHLTRGLEHPGGGAHEADRSRAAPHPPLDVGARGLGQQGRRRGSGHAAASSVAVTTITRAGTRSRGGLVGEGGVDDVATPGRVAVGHRRDVLRR